MIDKKMMKNMNVSNLVVVLVLAALVGVVYYFMYMKNVSEAFQGDEVNAKNDEVVMVLFYAEWCGHCQKFKPEWNKAENKHNGTKMNGKNVRLMKVDCDQNKELAAKYDVQGYPTVKVFNNGKVNDYDGERSLSGITNYLKTL
jgi:protein disulfide-isomerase A1